MREVITKPLRPEHIKEFQPLPLYETQFRQSLSWLLQLGKLDLCGIHLIEGRILFIGGYCEVAPGVAELFLYPSVFIHQYSKEFLREARWWVQYLKGQYRRVQCWGEDTDLSKRWLKKLGFIYEGTLHRYTSDGNMTIWGIA